MPDGSPVDVLYDWQGKVGQSAAVELKPLSGLAAGRTLEHATLNCERRRRIGANVHQAHHSAACQALHGRPPALVADDADRRHNCAESVVASKDRGDEQSAQVCCCAKVTIGAEVNQGARNDADYTLLPMATLAG